MTKLTAQQKKEAKEKIALILKEIQERFDQLEEISDGSMVPVDLYLPDGGSLSFEPWQASGGCEWEESRPDGYGWSASSC